MIDAEIVRSLALALPEAEAHDHVGRPSFRVRNKIFVTVWLDEQRAVLKLPVADQAALVTFDPETFSAVSGAWGNRGWTSIDLHTVERAMFQSVLQTAWRQVAPKRLIVASTLLARG